VNRDCKHVIGIYVPANVPCYYYGRGVDRDINQAKVRRIWALTMCRWAI